MSGGRDWGDQSHEAGSWGGGSDCRRRRRTGVTLVEMLIVLGLIGLMAAVSFPAVSSGLDRLRLRSAGDSLASFFSSALNWAERRQQAVEIVIDPVNHRLTARSSGPGYERRLELTSGVRIAAIQPVIPYEEEEAPRRIVVYPGGTAPAVTVVLAGSRGAREWVRIDPLTGTPEAGEAAAQ